MLVGVGGIHGCGLVDAPAASWHCLLWQRVPRFEILLPLRCEKALCTPLMPAQCLMVATACGAPRISDLHVPALQQQLAERRVPAATQPEAPAPPSMLWKNVDRWWVVGGATDRGALSHATERRCLES